MSFQYPERDALGLASALAGGKLCAEGGFIM